MEIFDIVDENGIPTGETADRETAHRLGLRHRTAHVWIIRERGSCIQALLQKRSLNKDSFPGRLDTSSAGHIPAGSKPMESALRELQEELGITASPEALTFIGRFIIRYEKEFHGRLFRDNEVSWVYLMHMDADAEGFTVQKEEIDSVEWHDMAEIRAAIDRHDPAYCVPGGGFALLEEAVSRLSRKADTP